MTKYLCFFFLIASFKANSQNISSIKVSHYNVSSHPELFEDGCGCGFSASKTDFKNYNFIFSNNGGESFMIINNKIQIFSWVKLLKINNYDVEIYNNETYSLQITFLTKKPSGPEGNILTGIIEIEEKSTAKKSKIRFIGGCGC